MTKSTGYETLANLPELAGLCGMNRAVASDWSLEESVGRLKRLHFVAKRLHEATVARIPSEPIYELKMLLSHHSYLLAEQVTLLRRRIGEMREPPLGLDDIPHPGLDLVMDELRSSPDTAAFVTAIYQIVLPGLVDATARLAKQAHPLADAPTARVCRLIEFELSDVRRIGQTILECLVDRQDRDRLKDWSHYLGQCISSAGGIDGTSDSNESVPARWYSDADWQLVKEPRRDQRFRDPYNAGVNPEAFLYSDEFDPRDKTLMMYYKRLREIDVPEMMATILVELKDDEPWEFHMEMSRQLWDEARHAMMGEVGFVSQGIDWSTIPINFTWSRNLNTQLGPRERHGVLFFIEQGLMPKSGKRFEWEIAKQSGDRLSALFQDFDWADEVLHAQIGRRWYVPKFESLNAALAYGDRCWNSVMSHWRAYRDEGLTEHRNWWPELYRRACENWQKEPDPRALAFCETYEQARADLRQIDPPSDQTTGS
jgi:hypothetical protein